MDWAVEQSGRLHILANQPGESIKTLRAGDVAASGVGESDGLLGTGLDESGRTADQGDSEPLW